MAEKKLKLPKLKNEDQERNFWSRVDLSDHFSNKDFEKVSLATFSAVSFPGL